MFYWIIFTLAMWITKIFFRVKEIDKENLYRCEGTRFILCPNHVHLLDPVFIAVQRFAKKRLYIMAKAELMKNPFTKWFLGKLQVIPIERGKGDSDTLGILQDRLKNGSPLLLFPEGTRSKDGNLQPLKSGALFIAAAADATILPCHISYGKNNRLRLFGRVYIRYGKPLTPDILGMNVEDKRSFRAAKQLLRQSLEELANEC